jgi:hypothetical protein
VKSISISSVVMVVILLLVALAAFAQPSRDMFCNAKFPPSAYINSYGLPTSPQTFHQTFRQGNVDGIPKLTVAVTITVLSLLRPSVL